MIFSRIAMVIASVIFFIFIDGAITSLIVVIYPDIRYGGINKFILLSFPAIISLILSIGFYVKYRNYRLQTIGFVALVILIMIFGMIVFILNNLGLD